MATLDFLQAIRDSIAHGVHNQSFKDGAFMLRIPKHLTHHSTLRSFDILIKSNLTSAKEKQCIIAVKNVYFRLSLKFPEGSELKPGLSDYLGCATEMEDLEKMFSVDGKARGLYQPPTMSQVMNDDGTVMQTIVFNEDGSTTVHEGGIPGVPPGAPEGFRKNQESNARAFHAMRDSGHQVACGLYQIDASDSGLPAHTGFSKAADASNDTTDKTSSGKAKVKGGDFGASFSKNLKGAFI